MSGQVYGHYGYGQDRLLDEAPDGRYSVILIDRRERSARKAYGLWHWEPFPGELHQMASPEFIMWAKALDAEPAQDGTEQPDAQAKPLGTDEVWMSVDCERLEKYRETLVRVRYDTPSEPVSSHYLSVAVRDHSKALAVAGALMNLADAVLRVPRELWNERQRAKLWKERGSANQS